MIITDGVHLVSTFCESELHQFAVKMGLKLNWYQDHPRHPHYDLTTPRALSRALANGARKVTAQELFKRAWWSRTVEMQDIVFPSPKEQSNA